MTDYADFSTKGADNVRKAGATQPLPKGGDGAAPGDTGSVPAVVGGADGPVVRPGGATNNGRSDA